MFKMRELESIDTCYSTLHPSCSERPEWCIKNRSL